MYAVGFVLSRMDHLVTNLFLRGYRSTRMGNTESGINQLRQAEPTKAVESEVYLE